MYFTVAGVPERDARGVAERVTRPDRTCTCVGDGDLEGPSFLGSSVSDLLVMELVFLFREAGGDLGMVRGIILGSSSGSNPVRKRSLSHSLGMRATCLSEYPLSFDRTDLVTVCT